MEQPCQSWTGHQHTSMPRRSAPMSCSYAASDVDSVDEDGRTALHLAAEKGYRSLVLQLLEAGADVEARTHTDNRTPLHLAAAAGLSGLVPLLITPTTLDAHDHSHRTALQLAVCSRHTAAVSELLAAGASQAAAQSTDAPLIMAVRDMSTARGGRDAQLPLLLLNALLADPGSVRLVEEAVRWRDDTGSTALHEAAMTGSQELVRQLIHAGADKDAVNSRGLTPLWWASVIGYAPLVPLLATPANMNLLDGLSGGTPLHTASGSLPEANPPSAAVVAALLAAGAAVDTVDGDNHSPLYWAAASGSASELIPLLLAALQSGQQQGQGHQQQHRHARLVEVVAAAVAHLSQRRWDGEGSCCCQLPKAVLDMLGPEVAGELVQAAGQLLQEEWERGREPQAIGHVCYLAEVLKRGWIQAEMRLHAARQPLVARLQRLVPEVGAALQQQVAVHRGQLGSLHPKVREKTAAQLLKEATMAAAAGQEQEALLLLEQYAVMHLRQQHLQQEQEQGVKPGLQEAATAHRQQEGQAGEPESPVDLEALSFHPPGVYTTFLAAWVGARRQLQQLPQEVAATVVAAAKAAQQRQGQVQAAADFDRVGDFDLLHLQDLELWTCSLHLPVGLRFLQESELLTTEEQHLLPGCLW